VKSWGKERDILEISRFAPSVSFWELFFSEPSPSRCSPRREAKEESPDYSPTACSQMHKGPRRVTKTAEARQWKEAVYLHMLKEKRKNSNRRAKIGGAEKKSRSQRGRGLTQAK